jgi:hypothetical protein
VTTRLACISDNLPVARAMELASATLRYLSESRNDPLLCGFSPTMRATRQLDTLQKPEERWSRCRFSCRRSAADVQWLVGRLRRC